MNNRALGSWSVRIERLPIDLAVVVHAYEHLPQPVQVSLVVKGRTAAKPGALSDCLDYAPLLDWLTGEWPTTPHVELLEVRLNELYDRVFSLDHRIDSVWAGLYKLRLGPGAVAVGVERGLTRAEFQALDRRPMHALRPSTQLQVRTLHVRAGH